MTLTPETVTRLKALEQQLEQAGYVWGWQTMTDDGVRTQFRPDSGSQTRLSFGRQFAYWSGRRVQRPDVVVLATENQVTAFAAFIFEDGLPLPQPETIAGGITRAALADALKAVRNPPQA